jgi:hypothetical protein
MGQEIAEKGEEGEIVKLKLFVCALLITGSAFADESLDGLVWKTRTVDEKNAYLYGFYDAMRLEANKSFRHYSDGSKTFGELAKLLDKFYADKANVVIPVHRALALVNLKVIGEKQSDIDQLIVMFRAEALLRRAIRAPSFVSFGEADATPTAAPPARVFHPPPAHQTPFVPLAHPNTDGPGGSPVLTPAMTKTQK